MPSASQSHSTPCAFSIKEVNVLLIKMQGNFIPSWSFLLRTGIIAQMLGERGPNSGKIHRVKQVYYTSKIMRLATPEAEQQCGLPLSMLRLLLHYMLNNGWIIHESPRQFLKLSVPPHPPLAHPVLLKPHKETSWCCLDICKLSWCWRECLLAC